MHQYTLVEDDASVHSSPQMEWNQVSVDDHSWHVGGHQWLLMLYEYQIPLNMHAPWLSIHGHVPIHQWWLGLSSTCCTHSWDPWDPCVLDLVQSDDPNWFEHAIRTLMHMEITVTTLLRVQHPYLLMKRPLMFMETITPPPGCCLWRKPLMALLHLVSYRLTCTSLSTQVLEPSWALIRFLMRCYLLIMDHIWRFQPHGIMMSYAPCLPGFLVTLLGKPLMS